MNNKWDSLSVNERVDTLNKVFSFENSFWLFMGLVVIVMIAIAFNVDGVYPLVFDGIK